MAGTGHESRQARAWCRAMMPRECGKGCGRTITIDDAPRSWHAGHILDRALGGRHEPGNYRPECATCNTSAGGKLAHAMKAQRKTTGQKFRPAFWFPPRTRG